MALLVAVLFFVTGCAANQAGGVLFREEAFPNGPMIGAAYAAANHKGMVANSVVIYTEDRSEIREKHSEQSSKRVFEDPRTTGTKTRGRRPDDFDMGREGRETETVTTQNGGLRVLGEARAEGPSTWHTFIGTLGGLWVAGGIVGGSALLRPPTYRSNVQSNISQEGGGANAEGYGYGGYGGSIDRTFYPPSKRGGCGYGNDCGHGSGKYNSK